MPAPPRSHFDPNMAGDYRPTASKQDVPQLPLVEVIVTRRGVRQWHQMTAHRARTPAPPSAHARRASGTADPDTAAARARADSTGESPWRERRPSARASGGGSCGVSGAGISSRNTGRTGPRAADRPQAPRRNDPQEASPDGEGPMAQIRIFVCVLPASASARLARNLKWRNLAGLAGSAVNPFDAACRGPIPEGRDVAVPRRARAPGQQDGHQRCRGGRAPPGLAVPMRRACPAQHGIAGLLQLARLPLPAPNHGREPLLHFPLGGELGPEASAVQADREHVKIAERRADQA